jgi:hypothetical protein
MKTNRRKNNVITNTKKVVRLNESDLTRIVKKVIKESKYGDEFIDYYDLAEEIAEMLYEEAENDGYDGEEYEDRFRDLAETIAEKLISQFNSMYNDIMDDYRDEYLEILDGE